jgi:hypothetical protein
MIRGSPASGNPELTPGAIPIVSFFEQVTAKRLLREMVRANKAAYGVDFCVRGVRRKSLLGVQACGLKRSQACVPATHDWEMVERECNERSRRSKAYISTVTGEVKLKQWPRCKRKDFRPIMPLSIL